MLIIIVAEQWTQVLFAVKACSLLADFIVDELDSDKKYNPSADTTINDDVSQKLVLS